MNELNINKSELEESLLHDPNYITSTKPPSIFEQSLVRCCITFYPTTWFQFLTFWILFPSVFFTIIFVSGSSPTWTNLTPLQPEAEKTSFSEIRALQYANILSVRYPKRYLGEEGNLASVVYLHDELTFLTTIFKNVRKILP